MKNSDEKDRALFGLKREFFYKSFGAFALSTLALVLYSRYADVPETINTKDVFAAKWYDGRYVKINFDLTSSENIQTRRLPPNIRKEVFDGLCNQEIPYLVDTILSMGIDPNEQTSEKNEENAKRSLIGQPSNIRSYSDIAKINDKWLYTQSLTESIVCRVSSDVLEKMEQENGSYALLEQAVQSWMNCKIGHILDYHDHAIALHRVRPEDFEPVEKSYEIGLARANESTSLKFEQSSINRHVVSMSCHYPKI